MKDELTKTDAEAQLSADVKKKETGALDAVMAKYDGRRRTSMAYGLASDVLTQKAGKNAYKGVAIASFFLLVLAIAAMFGVSFAAGEMLKDTEATNSTLATRDGKVLKTSPAKHAMPLLVAPVLEVARLEEMQTITVSYLDPTHNDTKVKAVLGLTGAKKISDTRVKFDVDSKWVEEVVIWDGYAFVVLPGAVSPCGAPPLRRPARPYARPPARSPPLCYPPQAAPCVPCARPTSRARRSRSTTPPTPTRSSRKRPRRSRRRATRRSWPRATGASLSARAQVVGTSGASCSLWT